MRSKFAHQQGVTISLTMNPEELRFLTTLLGRTSRDFAEAVTGLPEPTVDGVSLLWATYLAFRAADLGRN